MHAEIADKHRQPKHESTPKVEAESSPDCSGHPLAKRRVMDGVPRKPHGKPDRDKAIERI